MDAQKPKYNTPSKQLGQASISISQQSQKSVKNVAILGCGEVGGSLYHLLNEQRLLPGLRITKICVRNPQKARLVDIGGKKTELKIPAEMFCTADEIAIDENIHIVIDATAADMTDVLITALQAEKHVVSANKALISRRGDELVAEAAFYGVMLLTEACVQGKVPVLRISQYHLPLMPYFIAALLSGTCGYILSEVEKNPSTTVAEVLAKAQSLGYAEANPTADIEAFDATAKAKILARAYFGAPTLNTLVDDKILRVGISDIPSFAFSFASAFKHRIQLIGTIEKIAANKIAVVVMPSLVAKSTYLAGLYGVENGIVISELIGPPSRYAGPGAGGLATAAAIMGDLATVASAIETGIAPMIITPIGEEVSLASFDETTIRPVFLSSSPENEKGIFRAKAAVIENAGLSIEQILNDSSNQEPSSDCFDAIVCQAAPISLVLKAKAALEALPVVHSKVILLRVLGNEPFCFQL